MKTLFITTAIIWFAIGIVMPPIANAYSLAYQSSTLSFDNVNFASGFSQLIAPFQSFITSIQSDTAGLIIVQPENVIQSTTLPFISAGADADIQTYVGQFMNWFYKIFKV
jgi:hypothetical protein